MRKVIVFGASAGGIETLCSILEELPPNLAAAAMAVIHTTEESKYLPDVVRGCCDLEVISPADVEPVGQGRIYLPAPNRHLIVNSDCVMSWMGPRENRHRPAVDTLFRSAARAYRSHVIAVILSGSLDDGSAGALAVKSRGGTIVVQDPKDAMVKDMPANVLRQVGTDYCVPKSRIAPLLLELVNRGRPMKASKPSVAKCKKMMREPSAAEMEPTGFSCPDCGGALLEIKDRKSMQFRCHVGHTFSLESFTESHADALERALWVALRKLNEQRALQECLAKSANGNVRLKKRHLENAAAADTDMRLLHEILARL